MKSAERVDLFLNDIKTLVDDSHKYHAQEAEIKKLQEERDALNEQLQVLRKKVAELEMTDSTNEIETKKEFLRKRFEELDIKFSVIEDILATNSIITGRIVLEALVCKRMNDYPHLLPIEVSTTEYWKVRNLLDTAGCLKVFKLTCASDISSAIDSVRLNPVSFLRNYIHNEMIVCLDHQSVRQKRHIFYGECPEVFMEKVYKMAEPLEDYGFRFFSCLVSKGKGLPTMFMSTLDCPALETAECDFTGQSSVTEIEFVPSTRLSSARGSQSQCENPEALQHKGKSGESQGVVLKNFYAFFEKIVGISDHVVKALETIEGTYFVGSLLCHAMKGGKAEKSREEPILRMIAFDQKEVENTLFSYTFYVHSRFSAYGASYVSYRHTRTSGSIVVATPDYSPQEKHKRLQVATNLIKSEFRGSLQAFYDGKLFCVFNMNAFLDTPLGGRSDASSSELSGTSAETSQEAHTYFARNSDAISLF